MQNSIGRIPTDAPLFGRIDGARALVSPVGSITGRPLAEAAGCSPGVWTWDPAERDALRAELDAAYFHLYGYTREDVEHVLTTFQAVRAEDESAGGEGRTRRAVLAAFDELAPGLW